MNLTYIVKPLTCLIIQARRCSETWFGRFIFLVLGYNNDDKFFTKLC